MKKGILMLLLILSAGPIFMYYTLYTTLISPAKEAVKGIQPIAEEVDYWQTEAETRLRGAGDCEDFSILIGERYKAEGLPFRFVVIDMGDAEHMVLQVGAYYIDSVRPKLMRIGRYPAIWSCTYTEMQKILKSKR